MLKKTSMIGILFVPVLILSGCTISNTNIEDNQDRQEIQFESSEEVDLAYDFIIKNIEITANENISIDIQKGENSIIIIYTYNENLTEAINQRGLTTEELLEIANQVGTTSLEIQQYIKESININIDIETKIYDANDKLYIHIINDKLIEINPIKPLFETKEL